MVRKKLLLTLVSVFAMGGIAGGAMLKNGMNLRAKADGDYSLIYDATHTVTDAKIKSPSGSDIWTKANYNATFTSNGIEFTKYGYVQNLSALNGIKTITLKVTSGKYVISHGYVEPNDLKTPMYYDQTVDEDFTVNFDGDNLPTHFRIQCISDTGVIESIRIDYSCEVGAGDAFTETLAEGFENANLGSSFNYASSCYDTVVVCNSEFAVSQRALRFDSPKKNEGAAIIDLATNRSSLNLTGDEEYVIVDIKSTNSSVGTAINAVMFSGDVSDSTYNTGWQDPAGYYSLDDNEGWYRYFWKIQSSGGEAIPLSALNKVNLIFTKVAEANEVYYVDNVHIGTKPHKMRAIGGNYDVLAADRFTISGNELFSFDMKVTNKADSPNLNIGFGNWTNYFDLSLNPDGSRYDGGNDGLYKYCYYKPLANDWVRVYISTKDMNRINGSWKTWPYDGGANDVKVILNRTGNTATGYVTEPHLISTSVSSLLKPSTTYESYASVVCEDTESVSFTYKFVDNYTDTFSFMLSNEWSKYYGYFEFKANGDTKWGSAYSGVTVDKLGGGLVKVTMVLDQLKVSDSGAPSGITMFRTHSWGTGVIAISGLEVVAK